MPRVAVKCTRSIEAVEGISSEVPSGKATPSSINQSDSAPSLDLAEAIDAHFRRESHQTISLLQMTDQQMGCCEWGHQRTSAEWADLILCCSSVGRAKVEGNRMSGFYPATELSALP